MIRNQHWNNEEPDRKENLINLIIRKNYKKLKIEYPPEKVGNGDPHMGERCEFLVGVL